MKWIGVDEVEGFVCFEVGRWGIWILDRRWFSTLPLFHCSIQSSLPIFSLSPAYASFLSHSLFDLSPFPFVPVSSASLSLITCQRSSVPFSSFPSTSSHIVPNASLSRDWSCPEGGGCSGVGEVLEVWMGEMRGLGIGDG